MVYFMRFFALSLSCFLGCCLTACDPSSPQASTTSSIGGTSSLNKPERPQDKGAQVRAGSPTPRERAVAIASEPLGDYWIGRRYHVDRHRFWGYMRRPRQSWKEAQLVLMDERLTRVPDRLPERGTGLLNGYDNNYEYRIEGRFIPNKKGYDPFANRELSIFEPRAFTLLNKSPSWLFYPGETYYPLRFNLQPNIAAPQ